MHDDPRTQVSDAASSGADVLLLSCYELGHAPQALATAAAFLHEAGMSTELVDLAVQPLTDACIDAARFVAISVPMQTALQLGLRVARRIRERNASCRIAFFGHYAHLHAAALLAGDADLVLGGELEADLVAAVRRHLEQGAATPAHTHTLHALRFPVPQRDALPSLDAYAHLQWRGEHRLAGHVEATRGCRHRCRHCPLPAVYDGRLFAVPRESVLEDARQQIAAGARHLTFGDADFLNAPGQGIRILEAIHREFPEVTFDCTAKIEHLLEHAARLPGLAACGVVFIVSAVETLNDEILAILDKGHTRRDVLRAHALLQEVGIALRPSLMPFTPWTRWEDLRDLVDWVAEHDLVQSIDAVQYSIRLLVPEGSLLLDHPRMRASLGPYDATTLSYMWRYADEKLDALQRDLARLAESAVMRGEDAEVTFGRVQQRILEASPRQLRPAAAVVRRRRHDRPPRMTEPWFC